MTDAVSVRSTLLTDDQYALQESTRKFAKTSFPPEILQDNPGELARHRHVAWDELTAMGLTGLLVGESDGGSGGTLTDACVIAETLASEMAPLPYVATAIAGASVMTLCGGGPESLEQLARGGHLSLLVDSSLSWPPVGDVLAWGWSDGPVIGVDQRGVVQVRVPETVTSGVTFNTFQTISSVNGPTVEATTPDDSNRRALAVARVGCAAHLLGVASRALYEAVAYAKVREQYGQVIGSFQAVQHLCAEMLVDVETSRSVVYGASPAVPVAPIDDAERIGAAAKAWTSEAAIRVCETSIQVLGGIGVTHEHAAHLRLRDAHFFARALGTPSLLYEFLANDYLRKISK
jgi:alkylation response protein AidB-like acyl-CoA dehydrogenase